MKELSFGFIGLGLIGGSIAKALRNIWPQCSITAWDVDSDSLKQAMDEGIVDHAPQGIDASFHGRDYIFLCAPVQENNKNIPLLKQVVSSETVITDIGSVKTGIQKQIDAAGLSSQFIGGHPMTGSERTGFRNSKAGLLENAYYILTPAPCVDKNKVMAYKELIAHMGAIPLILPVSVHDYATAAVSHLPHIIASALVNLVRNADSEEGTMKTIAAGGFRDITRIASSSPVMWSQISLSNAKNIIPLLDRYIEALEQVRFLLKEQDDTGIHDFFESAGIYRNSFDGALSGSIMRTYILYVDIPDQTGALATVATLLASHGISIKNIGIVHNREDESGVLRIEFYSHIQMKKAAELLQQNRYSVYTGKD